MRLVEELTNEEFLELMGALVNNEEQARTTCQEYNVDFEDVACYDWGFEWQY